MANANDATELSGRETEVLYLAAEGLVDREISERLGVSEGTIRTYWERVRSKLGTTTRSQAVSLVLAKEHQNAIEELRLSELRLTLMLESADNMAIFTMDPAGIITTWNIGVQHVLGHTSEEFIGKPYSEIFIEADLLIDAAARELESAAHSGRFPEEQWHKKKGGSMVWVDGDLFSIKNSEGEVQFYMKVLQDATEEKAMRETIERQRLALEAFLGKESSG